MFKLERLHLGRSKQASEQAFFRPASTALFIQWQRCDIEFGMGLFVRLLPIILCLQYGYDDSSGSGGGEEKGTDGRTDGRTE